MDREELAWAAGFFDGEGCSYVSRTIKKRTGHYSIQPSIAVTQATTEILDKWNLVTRLLGKVYGPYAGRLGGRPCYHVRMKGFEKVQAVAAMLWPWLGAVKKEQFTRSLNTAREDFLRRKDLVHIRGNVWHARPCRCRAHRTIDAGLL